jgi:hypothetical protein
MVDGIDFILAGDVGFQMFGDMIQGKQSRVVVGFCFTSRPTVR